jgi:dihydroxyacid dehydratase (EC 4.2.1.9)
VKTAGVVESMLVFKGKAICFDSEESAIEGIMSRQSQTGACGGYKV